jgi:hypothetical protein
MSYGSRYILEPLHVTGINTHFVLGHIMCKDHILQIGVVQNMPKVTASGRKGIKIHPRQMVQEVRKHLGTLDGNRH